MFSLKSTPQNPKRVTKAPSSCSPLRDYGQPCPACASLSSLSCYACCLQPACQACFQSDHFLTCPRLFNKVKMPLSSSFEEHCGPHRSRQQSQKCQRCEEECSWVEYCHQCRVKVCQECSEVLHSRGKFASHKRVVSQSPSKSKRVDTVQNQNCEVAQPSRKEKRESMEQQYGLKAKDKPVKPHDRGSAASSIHRKGRSVAKVPLENQENTPFRHKRKNSMHENDPNTSQVQPKNSRPEESVAQEPAWMICSKHSRRRSILTQNLDLVCSECFEGIRSTVGKLKVIEFDSWLMTDVDKDAVFALVQSAAKYSEAKSKQLTEEFRVYKEDLERQCQKKKELLDERYRANINTVDKWQQTYLTNLHQLSQKCDQFQQTKTTLGQGDRKQLQKLSRLRSLLLFEEISKGKKDFSLQLDQYSFKTNDIGTNQFQDVLKGSSFIRKRIDNEGYKNASKTTQLRQSRISNTSIATDRKVGRNQSMVKSQYYGLSHGNHLARSRSKDGKEDLTKDISQKVLFPINNGPDKKDQKTKVEDKRLNPRNKNSHFFETPSVDESTKDAQVLSLGFKDVKYIDLETVITEKIEKNNVTKKESLQLSTPPVMEDGLRSSLYLGQATEALQGLRADNAKPYMLSDTRLTQSITVGQAVCSPLGRPPGAGSVNGSMVGAKNKRKSDYMQMRDRLRKPSGMIKIGK